MIQSKNGRIYRIEIATSGCRRTRNDTNFKFVILRLDACRAVRISGGGRNPFLTLNN